MDKEKGTFIGTFHLICLHNAQTINIRGRIKNFGCPDSCILEKMILIERLIALFKLEQRTRTEDWYIKFSFDLHKIIEIHPEVPAVNEDRIFRTQLILYFFSQHIFKLVHNNHIIDTAKSRNGMESVGSRTCVIVGGVCFCSPLLRKNNSIKSIVFGSMTHI